MLFRSNKSIAKRDLPSDLRKGKRILLHEEIRFCNFKGELIKKMGKGEFLTYKGKKKNKAWQDKWLSFKTDDGIVGIVSPGAMVNCFTFEEEK